MYLHITFLDLFVKFDCSLLHLVRVEWTLVAKNTECSGDETKIVLQPNAKIHDCAKKCNGVSSMFLFNQVYERCFCEIAATAEGSCTFKDAEYFDLYKYGKEGRFLHISRVLSILRGIALFDVVQ